MRYSIILCVLFCSVSCFGQTILPSEIQVKTALLAAPPEQRAETTVLGYNESGELVTMQEGSGNLICLADDPQKEGIKVVCYSVKLEPFMKRGRELIAAGKTELEKREIRKQETKAGKLTMPDAPSMLYVYTGTEENYNKTTGELKDGNFRYVVYVPFATAESTGLPTKPFVPGMPWIMDPGTNRAHIMITPPRGE